MAARLPDFVNCVIATTADINPAVIKEVIKMDVERKHMKYPYTMTAKIVRFPYKWHWDNFWFPRFIVASMILTSPFFIYIHRKVNTPENKAFWAEKHKQERKYHFD
ncbi:hypothetical protein TNIN_408171 [Trichonephila inaurata madagascariensis]|uniref:Uncharacterized protein n=1 Tax=Trichonephila inaurata madagascariensis TaxID=2747483 RepID=A0A8X6YMC9_9ARAC|nr:hypothetical protein TNIN_408171 [Trichonephila inaurata madagascariensis]